MVASWWSLGGGPAVLPLPLARRSRGSGCSQVSVRGEGLLGFACAQVRPVRKEGTCLRERLLARVRARGRRGAMANRDRVEHAATPAVLARQRRPVHVKAPAHAQVGKWQQRGERGASKRGHRPDLHEARLAYQAVAPAASHLPGGMRSAAVGGLGKVKLETLGKQQKAVEKTAGKHDVVVEDEQPVACVGGVRVEQQVEVLELAAVARRADAELDLMPGARQLVTNALHQRAVLGARHAQDEYLLWPRRSTRGDVKAQSACGRDLKCIIGDVEHGSAQAVKPADGAAFA